MVDPTGQTRSVRQPLFLAAEAWSLRGKRVQCHSDDVDNDGGDAPPRWASDGVIQDRNLKLFQCQQNSTWSELQNAPMHLEINPWIRAEALKRFV